MEFRVEYDTIGGMKIKADKLWGAQTQRSFENFSFGIEKMPIEVVKAYGYLKKACALSNLHFNKLSKKKV
jgi:fumarate hydratase class II